MSNAKLLLHLCILFYKQTMQIEDDTRNGRPEHLDMSSSHVDFSRPEGLHETFPHKGSGNESHATVAVQQFLYTDVRLKI